MMKPFWRLAAVAILAAIASSAANVSAQQPANSAQPNLSPAQQAKADNGVPPYTEADVRFIQGMIAHHAQAITMARLAPTHGAQPAIKVLAERIDVSQKDEIDFMQRWLKARGQTVPDADAHGAHAGMNMPGMPALMPGMLTPEQMAQLEKAAGPEFDRLFLTFMIQHHLGALTMVEQLFASHGAAQDDDVFKFASDVGADQSSEIGRMQRMLEPNTQGSSP
jgi:uncharacterized protein (DUF305 family)